MAAIDRSDLSLKESSVAIDLAGSSNTNSNKASTNEIYEHARLLDIGNLDEFATPWAPNSTSDRLSTSSSYPKLTHRRRSKLRDGLSASLQSEQFRSLRSDASSSKEIVTVVTSNNQSSDNISDDASSTEATAIVVPVINAIEPSVDNDGENTVSSVVFRSREYGTESLVGSNDGTTVHQPDLHEFVRFARSVDGSSLVTGMHTNSDGHRVQSHDVYGQQKKSTGRLDSVELQITLGATPNRASLSPAVILTSRGKMLVRQNDRIRVQFINSPMTPSSMRSTQRNSTTEGNRVNQSQFDPLDPLLGTQNLNILQGTPSRNLVTRELLQVIMPQKQLQEHHSIKAMDDFALTMPEHVEPETVGRDAIQSRLPTVEASKRSKRLPDTSECKKLTTDHSDQSHTSHLFDVPKDVAVSDIRTDVRRLYTSGNQASVYTMSFSHGEEQHSPATIAAVNNTPRLARSAELSDPSTKTVNRVRTTPTTKESGNFISKKQTSFRTGRRYRRVRPWLFQELACFPIRHRTPRLVNPFMLFDQQRSRAHPSFDRSSLERTSSWINNNIQQAINTMIVDLDSTEKFPFLKRRINRVNNARRRLRRSRGTDDAYTRTEKQRTDGSGMLLVSRFTDTELPTTAYEFVSKPLDLLSLATEVLNRDPSIQRVAAEIDMSASIIDPNGNPVDGVMETNTLHSLNSKLIPSFTPATKKKKKTIKPRPVRSLYPISTAVPTDVAADRDSISMIRQSKDVNSDKTRIQQSRVDEQTIKHHHFIFGSNMRHDEPNVTVVMRAPDVSIEQGRTGSKILKRGGVQLPQDIESVRTQPLYLLGKTLGSDSSNALAPPAAVEHEQNADKLPVEDQQGNNPPEQSQQIVSPPSIVIEGTASDTDTPTSMHAKPVHSAAVIGQRRMSMVPAKLPEINIIPPLSLPGHKSQQLDESGSEFLSTNHLVSTVPRLKTPVPPVQYIHHRRSTLGNHPVAGFSTVPLLSSTEHRASIQPPALISDLLIDSKLEEISLSPKTLPYLPKLSPIYVAVNQQDARVAASDAAQPTFLLPPINKNTSTALAVPTTGRNRRKSRYSIDYPPDSIDGQSTIDSYEPRRSSNKPPTNSIGRPEAGDKIPIPENIKLAVEGIQYVDACIKKLQRFWKLTMYCRGFHLRTLASITIQRFFRIWRLKQAYVDICQLHRINPVLEMAPYVAQLHDINRRIGASQINTGNRYYVPTRDVGSLHNPTKSLLFLMTRDIFRHYVSIGSRVLNMELYLAIPSDRRQLWDLYSLLRSRIMAKYIIPPKVRQSSLTGFDKIPLLLQGMVSQSRRSSQLYQDSSSPQTKSRRESVARTIVPPARSLHSSTEALFNNSILSADKLGSVTSLTATPSRRTSIVRARLTSLTLKKESEIIMATMNRLKQRRFSPEEVIEIVRSQKPGLIPAQYSRKKSVLERRLMI